MNYALEILEKEAEELKKIISAWDSEYHSEGMKLRYDKLKSYDKAIQYLKSVDSFNNSVEGKTI